MAQDPWDNVPVVPLPRQRQAATVNGQRYGVVSSAYTNETPEELAAQGYTLDPATGTYARTVGQVEAPQARSPWDSVPVAEELTPSQVAAQAEAERRILQSGGNFNSGGGALYQGLLAGGADEIAGRLAQVGQMGKNLIRQSQGQPIEINSSDLNDAVVNTYRNESARFGREHPIANIASQGAGGLLTGGLGAGVAGIRAAGAVGAAYGATGGFNSAEGGFAERLPGAAVGGVVGGVLGAGVQAAGQALAPAVSSVGSRLAGIANPGGAARAQTRRYGASVGAADRLSRVIGPEQIAERNRLQALGLNPSVLDTLDNTGERMIRSAAGPAGPAADLAIRNARTRTVDLKPEIMGVTRNLSGDPRTATQVGEALDETRLLLAERDYRPAYETPVAVTDDLMSALGDSPGRAALQRARQAAVARRNTQQVEEIDRLINAPEVGPLQPVSAGTLDRTRIAMSNRAESLGRNATGARDVAGGLRSRAGDIDAALSNVPELAPARSTYADLSAAIEQIDNAPAIFNTDPSDFARQVQAMTPTQREAAVIGLRQEILDTLGGQRAAGTGSLQNLSESNYARQNLETLLGAQEAQAFIGRIEAGVQQAQRANRVSPNTNSQTFGRSLDEETFTAANMVGAAVDAGQAATGNLVALGRTIDRIRSRATLSPQEREAIVQLGLGSADDLERIVQVAEAARRAGRRSREVTAYLTRTRNTLGAQSPVTQQLERLLLPPRVSAEEERE
jgi:hypothetical protein